MGRGMVVEVASGRLVLMIRIISVNERYQCRCIHAFTLQKAIDWIGMYLIITGESREERRTDKRGRGCG
jgi:hypothetical protein